MIRLPTANAMQPSARNKKNVSGFYGDAVNQVVAAF
jgi:hypothetical protein